jgi:hypothetical protein
MNIKVSGKFTTKNIDMLTNFSTKVGKKLLLAYV